MGAITPMVSYVGNSPTKQVGTAMRRIAQAKALRRPSVSPQ